MEIVPLGDGRSRVTVRLHRPDAEEVWLIGGLAGADPTDRRLRRKDDGWWERSYDVDDGARLSYYFTLQQVPSSIGDLIHDPENPATHRYAPNTEDHPDDEELLVSLVELPGAPPLRWSVVRDVPHGTVRSERVPSTVLDNERRVFTYRPPGYDAGQTYPLIVCFDGFAYVDETYVPLPVVLDNLIAAEKIPPVVALLPDSIDNETRSRELKLDDRFVTFLTEELLPWADERLSFGDDPARTVVAGSSLGGLTAAYCGLRRPDRFGLVLSQSGAFSRGLPGDFAQAERLPLRFWLDVGRYETMTFEQLPSLYHANLHMRDVLVAKGYEVVFREFAGGHDYFWWRETIADGLVALLG